MRKMNRKSWGFLLGAVMLSLTLISCGKNETKDSSLDDLKKKIADQQGKEQDDGAKDTKEEAPQDAAVNVDCSSEDEIRAFLAGEWTFLNRENGEDFATIAFEEDGTLTFTRLSDHKSCGGQIFFEERYGAEKDTPPAFRLKLTGMREVLPESALDYAEDEDETGGTFHIGCGPDTDYLYLTEIGNGDTMISYYVFNPDQENFEFSRWTNEWLFYRKNGGRALAEPQKNEEFYGWPWQREQDGSLLIEPMHPYEFDTYEDYSNRAFRGAYFTETEDIRAARYDVSDTLDLSEIYFLQNWNDEYPFGIYRFQTDANGEIVAVKPVDIVMYGVYDMESLDPSFSFDDRNFYYNDCTFALEEFAPGATAIMDCERHGDWIVVDCHVNPHYGLYAFFNIYYGDFRYEILGANLTFADDDLVSAVYSINNEVYDFWGHLIGTVDEGEVYDLAFVDNETISVTYLDNHDTEHEVEMEHETVDRELFLYYEFMMSGYASDHWKKFIDKAPEDAAALVITNPPEFICDLIPGSNPEPDYTGDKVCVLALQDHETVRIDIGEADAPANERGYGTFRDLDRSDAAYYLLPIPEGMPSDTLIVRTADKKEYTWEIGMISGRVPQHTIFVPEK